jgi:hypothetical protein
VIDIESKLPLAVDQIIFNAHRDPVGADALALLRGQMVGSRFISWSSTTSRLWRGRYHDPCRRLRLPRLMPKARSVSLVSARSSRGAHRRPSSPSGAGLSAGLTSMVKPILPAAPTSTVVEREFIPAWGPCERDGEVTDG